MLKEFAVDPAVMASSYETCRYLVSHFGIDRGRLISKFPRAWKRKAIEAAAGLPDGFKKERVVELVNSLDQEGLTLVRSNRSYAEPGATWLENALIAHAEIPFAAIICNREDETQQLLDANLCDEAMPLFSANRSASVERRSSSLAEAARFVLENSRKLRFVDPYFDPGRPKWRGPLSAFLSLVPDIRRVQCEYHILVREDSPSVEELIRRLAMLAGVIPDGGELHVVRWEEIDGGERFHRRYLLSEDAGLHYEGGLDEAAEEGQTTDISVLDRAHHLQRWAEFDGDSSVYAMCSPVLVVSSSGQVREAAPDSI